MWEKIKWRRKYIYIYFFINYNLLNEMRDQTGLSVIWGKEQAWMYRLWPYWSNTVGQQKKSYFNYFTNSKVNQGHEDSQQEPDEGHLVAFCSQINVEKIMSWYIMTQRNMNFGTLCSLQPNWFRQVMWSRGQWRHAGDAGLSWMLVKSSGRAAIFWAAVQRVHIFEATLTTLV